MRLLCFNKLNLIPAQRLRRCRCRSRALARRLEGWAATPIYFQVPALFGRIEILFLRIQHSRQRAQCAFELLDRRRRQRQPYRVRRMAGAGGERRRRRQRDVAPGRGGNEGLRTPVRAARSATDGRISELVWISKPARQARRDFLALLRIDPLQPRQFGRGAVAHQLLCGGECKSRRGPAAGAHRSHDVLAQPKRRDDEAERQSRRHLLGQAVEHHATIRRQRGQRRLRRRERRRRHPR